MLSKLKINDIVMVLHASSSSEKLGKLKVIESEDMWCWHVDRVKYRKDNGKKEPFGGILAATKIVIPTQDQIKEIRRNEKRKAAIGNILNLDKEKLEALSDNNLFKLHEVLKIYMYKGE